MPGSSSASLGCVRFRASQGHKAWRGGGDLGLLVSAVSEGCVERHPKAWRSPSRSGEGSHAEPLRFTDWLACYEQRQDVARPKRQSGPLGPLNQASGAEVSLGSQACRSLLALRPLPYILGAERGQQLSLGRGGKGAASGSHSG